MLNQTGTALPLMTERHVKLPADVESFTPWFNLIRRLISEARSGGYSVVTVRVIVDADGKPVQWAEPSLVRLEPRKDNEAILAQLLAALVG